MSKITVDTPDISFLFHRRRFQLSPISFMQPAITKHHNWHD